MEQKVTIINKTAGRGINKNNYTQDEIDAIVNAYYVNSDNKNGWLQELAEKLGRNKANISRFARQHGLSNIRRKQTAIHVLCVVCDKLTTNAVCCSLSCSSKYGTILGRKYRNGSYKGMWDNDKHPRGMLGKNHTDDVKKRISENSKKMWADPNSKLNSEKYRQQVSDRMSVVMVNRIKNSPNSIYSRTNKGWAEFSGGKRYYLKSGWELRYATHLDTLLKGKAILDWTYEEDTFWFEKIRRGVRSYTPDFKIYFKDGTHEYHEVKGWMDKKSATKLKRMGIYYPKETVIVIASEEMKNI